MIRLKIAWLNTFRNRRRSALNIMMIGGGVAAIVLFEGFAHNLVNGLRETTIRTQTGHLQIATKEHWQKKSANPKLTLIHKHRELIKEIRKNERVSYASGRLSFYGLLSHGDLSLSARGLSFDPEAEGDRVRSFHLVKGKNFSKLTRSQIVLGQGLAQRLRIKPRARVTLLTYTYDNVVNAVDMEVIGTFSTAISEFDDTTFIVHLKAAQSLLDTKGVEQIIVGLTHTGWTDSVRRELSRRVLRKTNMRARPWYDVTRLYHQVSAFNRFQNQVVELIILSLILLGVLNTVGMSIFERTGEIGTLRALGDTELSLIFQFLLEGVILGILGATVGGLLGVALSSLINEMGIPVVMPGASTYLRLKIDLIFTAFRDGFVLAMGAGALAAFIPALRASRMNIAESLKRNF